MIVYHRTRSELQLPCFHTFYSTQINCSAVNQIQDVDHVRSDLRNHTAAMLKPNTHLTNSCSPSFTMSEFARISPLSMACVDKGGNKGFVVLLDRSCSVSRRPDAIAAEAQNKQERLTSGASANTLSQRSFLSLLSFNPRLPPPVSIATLTT